MCFCTKRYVFPLLLWCNIYSSQYKGEPIMHGHNTILGVIELWLNKDSYDAVQKHYRIGWSGILLIMNRYKDSGLSFRYTKGEIKIYWIIINRYLLRRFVNRFLIKKWRILIKIESLSLMLTGFDIPRDYKY